MTYLKSRDSTAAQNLKMAKLYLLSQNKKLLMYITDHESLINQYYSELTRIKSTKFFKIWQSYCQFRDHFFK